VLFLNSTTLVVALISNAALCAMVHLQISNQFGFSASLGCRSFEAMVRPK
jgi:hypothetical protein